MDDGVVRIGIQGLLIFILLVVFTWRAAGAKSSQLFLLIIAFLLFAMFFATTPGAWLLDMIESIGQSAGQAELVDPANTRS